MEQTSDNLYRNDIFIFTKNIKQDNYNIPIKTKLIPTFLSSC